MSKYFEPEGTVHHNISIELLRIKILERKEAVESYNKSLVTNTFPYTGRSPNDRYIVDSPSVHREVNWSKVNVAISQKNYDKLHRKIGRYMSELDELFVYDGMVGADPEYSFHVRVASELAVQSLLSQHVLRKPDRDLSGEKPDIFLLAAPGCRADPDSDGTRSEAFIVLDLEQNNILVGASKYGGEIKKAIFTMMNYLLPEKGVFPMHCSANVGKSRDTALFFGLSGTGKTTLSADTNRFLVGDDEHGWSKNGIFNFEGGCYAKCINLTQENEPQIFQAIRESALVENVILDQTGNFIYGDKSVTENTRAAYPLHYIDNAVENGMADHPRNIIFLTADAFGILPPVARLDQWQAMYHFISGYTSKLAGTERGIVEPQTTFSTCFGAPFMPRHPQIYAKLLAQYMKKHMASVYLVNTGWSGGSFGVGHRISIKDTRNIITAILSGKLKTVRYRKDKLLNLEVPLAIEGVDRRILTPRDLWEDKRLYDSKARELAMKFVENMKKHGQINKRISEAGPKGR